MRNHWLIITCMFCMLTTAVNAQKNASISSKSVGTAAPKPVKKSNVIPGPAEPISYARPEKPTLPAVPNTDNYKLHLLLDGKPQSHTLKIGARMELTAQTALILSGADQVIITIKNNDGSTTSMRTTLEEIPVGSSECPQKDTQGNTQPTHIMVLDQVIGAAKITSLSPQNKDALVMFATPVLSCDYTGWKQYTLNGIPVWEHPDVETSIKNNGFGFVSGVIKKSSQVKVKNSAIPPGFQLSLFSPLVKKVFLLPDKDGVLIVQYLTNKKLVTFLNKMTCIEADVTLNNQ